MSTDAATPSSTIIAQVIVTHWTKRSRGEPCASPRNSVPERLPLPGPVTAARAACLVHDVGYGERNGFIGPVADRLFEHERLPLLLHSCVGLRLEGEELRIRFEGSYDPDRAPDVVRGYGDMGMPRRTVPLRPFSLTFGQWGQIRYVGRHSEGWEGIHVYRKYVFNIGWFHDYARHVFVHTEPQRQFASMPDVW